MPGVPATSGSWLKGTLNSLQAQINALATQQNHGVVDNNMTRRINWGWQSDTNTYGMVVFDPSGNKRVVVGQLPNGDHGIELLDTSGHTQELLPAVDSYAPANLVTTSATPVSIAGSPSVTVTIGASGDCKITAGAFADISGAGGAFAYLVIDGGPPESIFGLDAQTGAECNVQSTRRYSTWLSGTLTPGSHTFTMQYEASGGVTASFGANYLEVQPI